jgi:hypothetical protein
MAQVVEKQICPQRTQRTQREQRSKGLVFCWLRFPLRPLRPLRTKKAAGMFAANSMRFKRFENPMAD